MKTGKTFVQVFIKSKEDLPKITGIYNTRFGELLFKDGLWKLPDTNKTYFDFTDFKVDWYFLSVSEVEQLSESLVKECGHEWIYMKFERQCGKCGLINEYGTIEKIKN
jgi:hypothetical protein